MSAPKNNIPQWKPGARVVVALRNGEQDPGIVRQGNYAKGRGEWVDVEIASMNEKGKMVGTGKLLTKRPSELTKA